MKRHRAVVLAVTAATVFFATTGSQTLGQTRPALSTASSTTQPTTHVDQLIRQLGSEDSNDRDAAQKQLVGLGAAAVTSLKKAADHDDDLEIRSRAAAALSQINAHELFDASLITLHLKDAVGQDALAAIAGQAHAQFTGTVIGMPAGGPMRKLINLDADQKPFWDVMADVCRQMNTCPGLDTPTKNTLRLAPIPRNWFLECPHQIVGPYWVGVAGISRMRSIELMGPQVVDDQFNIRFIVYPEPKLAVTQISEFDLKEAADDAGNSLLPTAPPIVVPAAAMGIGMVLGGPARSPRQTPRTVGTRLTYPDHPGKRIAVLRGNVVVTLAEGVQQFVVDDLMGKMTQSNPVGRCQIKIATQHNNPELYTVVIECTRDGMADEQWQAMQSRVNDITLEDADGHALTPFFFQPTELSNSSTFKGQALFSKNIYSSQLLNRQVTGKTGDARRLTWNIPTRLRPVTVPVNFNDLPMP